jgi:hypothetical protein
MECSALSAAKEKWWGRRKIQLNAQNFESKGRPILTPRLGYGNHSPFLTFSFSSRCCAAVSYELPPLKTSLLHSPARRVHQSTSRLDTTHLPRRVVLTAMPLDITGAHVRTTRLESRAVFATQFKVTRRHNTPKTIRVSRQSDTLSAQCPKRTGAFKCDFCLLISK